MSVIPQTERERRVLAYINRVRRKLGLRPVAAMRKGDRESPTSCPIARTIAGQSQCLYAEVFDQEVAVIGSGRPSYFDENPPSHIISFVRAFDAGRLKRYERGRRS